MTATNLTYQRCFRHRQTHACAAPGPIGPQVVQGRKLRERARDLLDVVRVVTEVDRQTQIAVPAAHTMPRRVACASRPVGSAAPSGTDTMLLRLATGRSTGGQPTSQSDALSAPDNSRFPAWIASTPKTSKTERAASFPIAASQLTELSKHDAVGESSMAPRAGIAPRKPTRRSLTRGTSGMPLMRSLSGEKLKGMLPARRICGVLSFASVGVEFGG